MTKFLVVLLLSIPPFAFAQTASSEGSAAAVSMPAPVAVSMPAPVVIPIPVDVPTDPLPSQDVVAKVVDSVWKAIQNHNYAFLAGLVLMGIVWMARKKLPVAAKMDPEMIPLLSLIIAGLPALAVVLMQPGVTVQQVVTVLGSIWLLGAGTWENVCKPLLKLGDKFNAWVTDRKEEPVKPSETPVEAAKSVEVAPVADPAKPKE